MQLVKEQTMLAYRRSLLLVTPGGAIRRGLGNRKERKILRVDRWASKSEDGRTVQQNSVILICSVDSVSSRHNLLIRVIQPQPFLPMSMETPRPFGKFMPDANLELLYSSWVLGDSTSNGDATAFSQQG